MHQSFNQNKLFWHVQSGFVVSRNTRRSTSTCVVKKHRCHCSSPDIPPQLVCLFCTRHFICFFSCVCDFSVYVCNLLKKWLHDIDVGQTCGKDNFTPTRKTWLEQVSALKQFRIRMGMNHPLVRNEISSEWVVSDQNLTTDVFTWRFFFYSEQAFIPAL